MQITHLVVESLELLSSVVARASDTLSQSAIDMVHFRVPSADVVATMPRELEQNGLWKLFVSLDGSLRPADGGAPLLAGYYVAMQRRVAQSARGTVSRS